MSGRVTPKERSLSPSEQTGLRDAQSAGQALVARNPLHDVPHLFHVVLSTGASSRSGPHSDRIPEVTIAAVLAVLLLAVISAFQIALAVGAPFGKAAWGGKHEGALPKRLRIASGIAGFFIYPVIIVVILIASDLIDVDIMREARDRLMWAFAGLFALGAIANLVSRSSVERYWAVVSLALAVCCGIIAAAL
jgi:hypothetical protein